MGMTGYKHRRPGGIAKIFQVMAAFFLCLLMLALANYFKNLLGLSSPSSTPTSAPQPTATKEATHGVLLELLESGKIEIQIKALGIDELQLDLRPLVEELLDVEVPAGMYFVSHVQTTQNMVVVQTAQVLLETKDWVELLLQVACANMHRSVPSIKDAFDLEPAHPQESVQRLIQVLDPANKHGWEYNTYPVEQAAIWILTDDATFDDLGILQKRSTLGGFPSRMIREPEVVRAMQLIEQAGFDIVQMAIWGDRERILDGLQEQPDLAGWLQEKGAESTPKY